MDRVIVTEDAPSYGVLGCVRALRAGGYEPWVATAGRSSYAAWSRARSGTITLPDPTDDAGNYAERLARAAADVGAVAVLPGTDRALVALSGREGLFADGVAVGTCSPPTLQRATDKSELARLGSEAGLPAPPSRIVSIDDAQRGYDLAYPAVIKPLRLIPDGSGKQLGGVGVQRIENSTELLRAIARREGTRWLVQPYLVGELEAAVGVAWRGQVVCVAHQVAARIYPPECGISAYAQTIPGKPELERRIRRLIELLALSGMFQIQMLNTAEGHYVIDVNLRPYGSLALAVAAGLNLPTIWTHLLVGRPVHTHGYRVGIRYRSEERDAGALVTALSRHQWRTAANGLRPRRGTVHAVFSIRDPLPVLNSLRHARTALAHLASSSRSPRARDDR